MISIWVVVVSSEIKYLSCYHKRQWTHFSTVSEVIASVCIYFSVSRNNFNILKRFLFFVSFITLCKYNEKMSIYKVIFSNILNRYIKDESTHDWMIHNAYYKVSATIAKNDWWCWHTINMTVADKNGPIQELFLQMYCTVKIFKYVKRLSSI